MYAYTNKKARKKIYAICGLSAALVFCTALSIFLTPKEKEATPIIKEEESVVISLPNSEEKVVAPYAVEAGIVKEYFDGSDHEIADYTNLNGVYRPNQGIDYGFNNEAFDVLAMLSGKVSEVKNDPLFGNSVTIQSGEVYITYQSLDAINMKKDDEIKQGSVIAKASVNVYNPDLGNHVHIVVMKNEVLKNPKTVIGKMLSELK